MAYDAGDFGASLDAAMKAIDYAGFAARKAKAKSEGKLRGIGVSCYIEACGIAPSKAVGSLGAGVGLWESAEVRVNPVGTIEVLTGSHSHGQGHETTFCAAGLRAPRRAASARSRSSTAIPTRCSSAWAPTARARPRSACTAIVKAMEKVEAKAKKIAAHVLEASEGDIVIENGEFKVTGTDKSIALPMVALAAYTAHNLPDGMEPGLKERRVLRPDQLHLPGRRLHLRGRGRSRHRQDHIRQFRRGRRFRPADQPDDRRRPGPWRARAGHRPGAAGRRRL